jgi:hypothetical protein
VRAPGRQGAGGPGRQTAFARTWNLPNSIYSHMHPKMVTSKQKHFGWRWHEVCSATTESELGFGEGRVHGTAGPSESRLLADNRARILHAARARERAGFGDSVAGGFSRGARWARFTGISSKADLRRGRPHGLPARGRCPWKSPTRRDASERLAAAVRFASRAIRTARPPSSLSRGPEVDDARSSTAESFAARSSASSRRHRARRVSPQAIETSAACLVGAAMKDSGLPCDESQPEEADGARLIDAMSRSRGAPYRAWNNLRRRT